VDIRPDYSGMHVCAHLLPDAQPVLSDLEIADKARANGLALRTLSAHCALPDPMQGLLMGFAAFDEQTLSDGVQRLQTTLAELGADP